MKRRCLLFLCIFLGISLHLFAFDAYSTPTSLRLSWEEVPGAVYYDVYVDGSFIVRLDSSVHDYEVRNLLSGRTYELSFAARDQDNNTLEAQFATLETGYWDGTYKWVNPTNEDNDGLVKDLEFRAHTVVDDKYGQYIEVYTSYEGKEYRIIPLYDLDELTSEWTKWDAQGPEAETYRVYASRFNTSSFTPSKWKLGKINFDSDVIYNSILSKFMGIEVETVSIIRFDMDRDGKMTMSLQFEGGNLVKKFMFMNPEVDSDGIYTMQKVD